MFVMIGLTSSSFAIVELTCDVKPVRSILRKRLSVVWKAPPNGLNRSRILSDMDWHASTQYPSSWPCAYFQISDPNLRKGIAKSEQIWRWVGTYRFH